jgi:hypothetical protein
MCLKYMTSLFFMMLMLNAFGQPKIKSVDQLKIAFDSNQNQTATYQEIRTFYRDLDKLSPLVTVTDFGMTDSGHPLQVVVIADQKHFTPEKTRKAGKAILLINNGIHPGEPDGIDASMLFARDLCQNIDMQALLSKVTIVIVPVYNIGGCLNRTATSRANQNGPEMYGFRANSKNLDLNRDFIKCDSKNAMSFNQIFNHWNPDVMIDTHTSNGADYTYTMTLIATQKDKLQPSLRDFLSQNMLPYLYNDMAKKGWEMIPYVNTRGLPDKGIYGFMDTPRYSSGYAALHHTISFMPETHMLKPYKDRVLSTKEFIITTFNFVHQQKSQLLQAREVAIKSTLKQDSFALSYKVDESKVDSMLFKGYKAAYKKSEVSGLDRLYYDRFLPWQAKIPFYNEYNASLKVKKPKAYIIPQAYDKVINLLVTNGVKVQKLEKDTIIQVEMYRVESYDSSKTPYEGHFNHSNVKVSTEIRSKQYYRGDFIIYTDQKAVKFLVETVEPQAPDSYFCWNFFDGVLAQKEYFSDYVFEDLAAEYLNKNAGLRAKLEQKKAADATFASDGRAQLDFVYKNSPWYESTHRLYPVGRLVTK